LALDEIPGSLPGISTVVCWCAWRFAPVDISEASASSRRKKARPTKTKAASKPCRLELVPV
jgi:hypothetical protein